MSKLPCYFENKNKLFDYEHFPNYAKNYYNNYSICNYSSINEISSKNQSCCKNASCSINTNCQNKNNCQDSRLIGHYMSVNRCKKKKKFNFCFL